MSIYILPKEKIPKPFNQNIVDENGNLLTDVGSCVACTFTKILEVINYIKTGEYVELSKGYMYGRNNYAGKRNPGMSEEYTLDVMLKRGTVPVSMCSDYDEIPDIAEVLGKRRDIFELDKEAEKYAILSWENISGNNAKERFNTIKEYLRKYEIPLAGTLKKYKGISYHSVVIVGYEDDYVLFHNHTGKDEVEKIHYNKVSRAYYICCGDKENKQMKFKDVEDERWSKKYIDKIYKEGIMLGVSEEEFKPTEGVTREQLAAVLCRALFGME